MSHLPRRLRKPRGPRWALITTRPISREQAEEVKRQWQAASRKHGPIVLDGTRFDLKALR